VSGPYSERGGTRFRIRILGDGSAKNLYFPTLEAALASKAEAEQQLRFPSHQRVGELMEAFFAERERSGLSLKETIANERERLRYFLADLLDLEIHTVTPRRAEEIYRVTVERPSAKTGKPLEAASHRFYLGIAKRFFAWATKQGMITRNPFQEVRPQGRPKVGKPQLRIDEASRFVVTALKLCDQEDDELALAAVVALLMGMRASEVLKRRTRDVDCSGRVLWIDGGKTRNARRHLKVPVVLQERLAKLCTGKSPDDLLFGTNSHAGPRHHRVLWNAVGKICLLAQVPRVCTHSLRGLWATLSVESGALSDVVAASLGHGSFAMTAKHYAQPEAVSEARTARVLDLLQLNNPEQNPTNETESLPIDEKEAAQLLARLPRTTLERLLLLARRESESA